MRISHTWPKESNMQLFVLSQTNIKMLLKLFEATSSRRSQTKPLAWSPELRELCKLSHLQIGTLHVDLPVFVNRDPVRCLNLCFLKLPRYIRPGWHGTIWDRVPGLLRCKWWDVFSPLRKIPQRLDSGKAAESECQKIWLLCAFTYSGALHLLKISGSICNV